MECWVEESRGLGTDRLCCIFLVQSGSVGSDPFVKSYFYAVSHATEHTHKNDNHSGSLSFYFVGPDTHHETTWLAWD